MTPSPRPHKWPCVCQECCEYSAAAFPLPLEIVQRTERLESSFMPKDEPSLEDIMRKLITTGCKESGLTEEEMRREMKLDRIETPAVTPTRDSRAAVKARGVPEIHLEHVYDVDPVDCDALQNVRAFLGEPRESILVLSGAVGIRKTGSACWALVHKPGRFITVADYVRLAAAPQADEDSRNRWRMVREGQVLILDDMGGEYVDNKGWAVQVLTGIIDFRYSNRLKTIVTTNLDEKEFRAAYQDRICDRINEIGRFHFVPGSTVRT